MFYRWMPALLLCTTLLTFASAADPDPEPGYVPEAKFQYAELTVRLLGIVGADGTRTTKSMITFSTSTKKIEAGSWDDLAKQLKAPEPKKGESIDPKLRVLDQLGSQGWEVIRQTDDSRISGFSKTTTRSATGSYFFKRKVVSVRK